MTSSLSVRIRGVGPFYFATETRCTVRKHLSKAWITEMAPPYRKGNGVRLRISHYAVQFGTCRKTAINEDADELIEHVGWRKMPEKVDDISRWVPPDRLNGPMP